jgi:hypothetical protein
MSSAARRSNARPGEKSHRRNRRRDGGARSRRSCNGGHRAFACAPRRRRVCASCAASWRRRVQVATPELASGMASFGQNGKGDPRSRRSELTSSIRWAAHPGCVGFRSLTPDPPSFSSMKSTPASSGARHGRKASGNAGSRQKWVRFAEMSGVRSIFVPPNQIPAAVAAVTARQGLSSGVPALGVRSEQGGRSLADLGRLRSISRGEAASSSCTFSASMRPRRRPVRALAPDPGG